MADRRHRLATRFPRQREVLGDVLLQRRGVDRLPDGLLVAAGEVEQVVMEQREAGIRPGEGVLGSRVMDHGVVLFHCFFAGALVVG